MFKNAELIIEDLKNIESVGYDRSAEIEIVEHLKKYEITLMDIFPNSELEINIEDHPRVKWYTSDAESRAIEIMDEAYKNDSIIFVEDYNDEIAKALTILKEFNIIESRDRINSGNWSAYVTMIISEFTTGEAEYTVMSIHRFGDIRGNYSLSMLLDMTRDEFLEALYEINECRHYDDFYITQNVLAEHGYVSVYEELTGAYADMYLHSDLEDAEEVVKEIKRYFDNEDNE
jgi:predicted nuclease of predicted toxin-antitoxin system